MWTVLQRLIIPQLLCLHHRANLGNLVYASNVDLLRFPWFVLDADNLMKVLLTYCKTLKMLLLVL
jgi:hypothetical protein